MNIGDKVYAGYEGDCVFYGEIDAIDHDNSTCDVSFETEGGGGRLTFGFDDVCYGCDKAKKSCVVKS